MRPAIGSSRAGYKYSLFSPLGENFSERNYILKETMALINDLKLRASGSDGLRERNQDLATENSEEPNYKKFKPNQNLALQELSNKSKQNNKILKQLK